MGMEIKEGVDYAGRDGRMRRVVRLDVSASGTPLVVYRLESGGKPRPNHAVYRTECCCSASCFMSLVEGART